MELYNTIILLIVVLSVPNLRRHFFIIDIGEVKKRSEKRLPRFDYLKGIAIIAVIMIHIVLFFYRHSKDVGLFYFGYINNTLRFAIPVFLVVSGILLKGRFGNKADRKLFYKKRLASTYVPFIVASLLLILYSKSDFSQTFSKIVNGNASEEYYYIIVLFQLHLVYPFLYKWRKAKYFLVVTFLFSLAVYTSTAFINWGEFPFFGKYLYLFAYGVSKHDYYLSQHSNSVKYIWVILPIFLVFSLILNGYYFNVRYFYGIAIFNALYFSKMLRNKMFTVIEWCGKHSLWIYLTHYTVLFKLYLNVEILEISVFSKFLLIWVIALPVSIVVAYVAENIYKHTVGRMTRKIVGLEYS